MGLVSSAWNTGDRASRMILCTRMTCSGGAQQAAGGGHSRQRVEVREGVQHRCGVWACDVG